MKRGLSVLILATVLLNFFLPFSSLISKVKAQSTNPPNLEDVRSSLLIIGSNMFDTAIRTEERIILQTSTSTNPGRDSAAVLEILKPLKANFVSKYNSDRQTNPYTVYRAALNESVVTLQQKLVTEQNNYIRSKLFDMIEKIRRSSENAGISQGGENVNAETVNQAATITNEQKVNKCSLFDGNLVDCIDSFLAWFIKVTLLQFAGFFVYLGATLLDYSIKVGIYDFASLAGEHFYPVWVVVKDVVNLAVLFFGLGIIILYLINKGDNIKQFVPWVILYAIFVNFSWTATRTVVDYSNILTLKMYQIVAPGAMNATAFDTNIGTSPATIIMGQLGLQTITQRITSTSQGNSSIQSNIQSAPVALLFVLMAFYTALLFFIATIIFAARTVILLLFIIFSPILLLDTVLPWVGEHVKKARNIFFSQLTVGFIFMFLFAVIVQLMAIFKPSTNIGGALTGSSTNLDSTMFFGLLVVLIMLHLLLKLTWSTSKGMLAPILNTVVGAALTAASGGTALIARSTIGAGAGMLARSSALDRMQGSRIGRGVMSAAQGLSNSSFNVGNIPRIQQGFKSSGIPLYSPTVSYEQKKKEVAEKVQAKASTIVSDRARQRYLNQKSGLANQAIGLTNRSFGTKIRNINTLGQQAGDKYTEVRADRFEKYNNADLKGQKKRYENYKDIREEVLGNEQMAASVENKLGNKGIIDRSEKKTKNESGDINATTETAKIQIPLATNRATNTLAANIAADHDAYRTNVADNNLVRASRNNDSMNFDRKEIDDFLKSKNTTVKDIAQALKSSSKIADKIEISNNTNTFTPPVAPPKASPGEQNVTLKDVKPTNNGSGGAPLEASNEVDLRKEISEKPNPFADIGKHLEGYVNTPKPNPSI